MYRALCFIIFAELGLAFVGLGFLMPAHMRALDAAQVELAGRNSPSLMSAGLKLVELEKVGAAQFYLHCAPPETSREKEALEASITNYSKSHPELLIHGGGDPYLQRVFYRPIQTAGSQSFVSFIRRSENLDRIFQFLQASQRSIVGELLKKRSQTNTVYFPNGQALDTVIALTGLLLQGDQFSPSMHEEVAKLVLDSNRSGDSRQIELVFLDLLSLGSRLNWNQFTLFIARIDTPSVLKDLARLIRGDESQIPNLFSAVCFSGQPGAVADYLTEFAVSGYKDVDFSMKAGQGALNELLNRQQRIYYPFEIRGYVAQYEPFKTFYNVVLGWCPSGRPAVLLLKWLFYFCGGFFLARSWNYARGSVSGLERPLQVPALQPARQGLWAMFFLLVLVSLSEPFLAQESQQVDSPFGLQMPRLGAAIPAVSTNANQPLMTQLSVFSLLLFFVLQALIYTACLLKLAEIRRQNANPRLKLRLLENEEHLFDAGLYLGFVGTIISLILMSMGIVKPSLMAGYSSTSFGIIFVSILKIFHLRPLRRKLILESETQTP